MNTKQYLIISFALIVVAGATALAGYKTGYRKGVDYELNFAKNRISTSFQNNPIFFPKEVTSITGQIVSIEGSALVIKITPLEPLADVSLDERIITIDPTTKIVRAVPVDQKVFSQEMDAFFNNLKQASSSQSAIVAPDRFTKQPAQINDVKVGDTVTVTSNQNIKDIKQFVATEIQLN